MSLAQDHNISVKILDKHYDIRCPSDMVQELQNAADFVDHEMRSIRDSGKVVGMDRIAVITALNIAYKLMTSEQKENKSIEEMSDRIREMQKRLVDTMTHYEQESLL